MFDTTKSVLGIDIGKVLMGDTDGKVLSSTNYLDVPEIPGAIRAVKELYVGFEGQVCLVSKCGGVTQVKTRHWFAHREFFQTTGVDPNHIFFCEERVGKAPICKQLGVTHFIDDRLEVLGYLHTVRYRYLFRPNEKEVLRNIQHRNSVRKVESWQELLNVIQIAV